MTDSTQPTRSTAFTPGEPKYKTLVPLFDELRDERVIVRPYREEDAAALQEAIAESREHLRPFLPFYNQQLEESRDWVNRQRAAWILREDLNSAIFDATGRFVGGAGLHPKKWEIRSFEIGYWLRASAEGKGYMTAAVRLLTDFAMNELHAQSLMIRCAEENVRSAAVAKRLGYKYEGILRNDRCLPDGRITNTLFFSLVPGEGLKRET